MQATLEGRMLATVNLFVISAAVALVAVACDAPSPVQTKSVGAQAMLNAGLGHMPLTPPMLFDDIMEDIGKRAPGFAGVTLDKDGNLVLMHTKGADIAGIDREVRAYIAVRGPHAVVRVSRDQEVTYTFAELATLRRAINPYQFHVQTVDIDEVRNRLVLGVTSDPQATALRKAILSMGQSLDAVVIEIVAPPVQTTLTLQDSARPVIAGLALVMQGGGGCTLGPTVRVPTWKTRYILTNSHCTATPWAYDAGAAHQPFIYNPWSTYFGAEAMDPPPFYGYPLCPTSTYCRQSDAAVIQFEDTTESAFKIARTTDMVMSPGTQGGLTRASPDFAVIDTFPYADLLVGQYLHKVGQMSGWSFGQIGNTCFDIWNAAFGGYVRCNFKAAGTVMLGDSGSPMFVWWAGGSGYDAGVAGILWGTAHVNHYIDNGTVFVGDTLVFSPWYHVMIDFGQVLPFP